MTTSAQMYALIVGVDHYQSPAVPDLRGCVADARAMYTFLTLRMRLPADQVRLLTASGEESAETRATHANLVAGWQWLIDKADTDVQIFFHYSGHGAQARSIDPNETDGFDETLVPCDSRDKDANGNPVYDLLDKELATLIDQAEAKGALVTTILDCCHSGSGTRAAEDPDLNKPLTRRGPSDKRVRPPETLIPGTLARLTQVTEVPKGNSGWQIRADSHHVLLAGCRDEELSHEYRAPETGEWHGATTHFLLKALQGYRPDLTWGEVYDTVQIRVNAAYETQMPQLEGPGNRTVFGKLAAPAMPYLLVTQKERDGSTVYVKINGGAAVGLSEGSRVAIYPAGDDKMSGAPLATGVVEQTKVDHVWARLESAIAADAIPDSARVKITARGYDSLLYAVAVDDIAVRAALEGGKGGLSPFLQLTNSDDPGAQFRVITQGDRYVIQDGAGVQIIRESQPRNNEGADVIARQIEHLAVYNNVRNLRNPTPPADLANAIEVEAQAYTRASFSGPSNGMPLEGADNFLTPGHKIWLTFRNKTSETLYVSVFNLNADYGIQRIYPPRAPHATVAPGSKFDIQGIEPKVNNPFVAKSREILKVFVTRVPMSFDVLEMTKLNEPAREIADVRDGDPLAALLRGVRRKGTRDLVIGGDDTPNNWLIKQVEIGVLANNETRALPAGQTTVDLGSPLQLKLEKPADFSGELIFSSLTQQTRGLDIAQPLPLPPGLSHPDAQGTFQPLSLTGGTRATAGSPAVLALNTSPQQLAAVDADHPLRLSLTVDDEPDLAGILPVAYDGDYFYLAGQMAQTATRALDQPGSQRLAVEITDLPLPAGVDGSEGARTAGDVATRDLKRTVRLFLYKVYKGGELPADTGLRRAERAADGTALYYPAVAADLDGIKRAALLIHGFTSDTGWFVAKVMPVLQTLQGYDLYLTYDYETFNTSVLENGTILAQALTKLGFSDKDEIHLDVFCHSMGTQVARVLVELKGGAAYVDRVFMGGPPNAGTRLAEAKKLIFWLGTTALNHTGPTPPSLIANWFFKKSLDSAVSIEDMMPRSALYEALNDSTEAIDVPYFVLIGTNTALDSARLFSRAGLMKIFDAGLDAVLGGPNDLAIGVSSARGVRHGHWPRLHLETLPGNHFEYFYTPESIEVLRAWLTR